jgi:hypothetical protein
MLPPPPAPDIYGNFKASGDAPQGQPAQPTASAPPGGVSGAPGGAQQPQPATGGGFLFVSLLAAAGIGYWFGRRRDAASSPD